MIFCFKYKINKIVNKCLLVGDKFRSEIHLKQLIFAYSACGLLKTKKEFKKFMQTGNTDYIFKNDLDKTGFQHDMAYCKFKDLNKRTQSDEVLRHQAFEVASYP